MNLLSVPVEVVDTCLLPYLGWNELLRLRRTCKKFKNLTENYMRRHTEMAPELEINEKEKDFRAFLTMDIPSKRIFLNNQTGNQFFNKAPTFAAQFLQKYGPIVTHLRMEKFSVWCTEKGKQFLEGFPNLVSFEAAQTALKRGGLGENPNRNRTRAWTNLPSVFERLQVLKLYQTNPDVKSVVLVRQVLEELLGHCPSLEHFCIPFPAHGSNNSLHEHSLSEFFRILNSTVLHRNGQGAVDGQGPFSRVKCIEFSGYPEQYMHAGITHLDPDRAQEAFYQLCLTCTVNNVKLINVRHYWYSYALLQNWQVNRIVRRIGVPVVSLTAINFAVNLTRLKFPNLEKLKLNSLYGWLNLQRVVSPCNLPMLKSLDLTFNGGHRDSEAMCRYFFEGVVHQELIELHLAISMSPELETVLVGRLAERLADSCPRLKKLTIFDLKGNCEDLVAILERFETLEEVNFIRCSGLKNADFVGPDAENPSFHRLTSLRKMSLIDLDSMPNLSDDLFSTVIRHIELTHLTITTSYPIETVTLQGIESLLEGPFSESIEKFSFEGWTLDQVSSEDFQAMGKKFRCGNIV